MCPLARCDCAGSRCNCVVEAGDGIQVTGSGDAANPYTISGVPQPIEGLLTVQDTGSLDLNLVGQGTQNEPFVLSGQVIPGPAASIEGLIEPGQNITITGTGTDTDPYIIAGDGSATIAGLIEAGTNVTLTGSGSAEDPYIINVNSDIVPDSITGLVTAGTNVTLDGTGTTEDPYVINSGDVEPAITDLIEGGLGTTLAGTGTEGDPYVVNVDSLELNDLANVTSFNPSDGQVLRFSTASDGGTWVSATPLFVPQDPTQRGQYLRTGTINWDPPSVPVGGQVSVEIPVTGVTVAGEWVVHAAGGGALVGLIAHAAVTNTGIVTLYLANMTDNAVNLGTRTWRVYAWR